MPFNKSGADIVTVGADVYPLPVSTNDIESTPPSPSNCTISKLLPSNPYIVELNVAVAVAWTPPVVTGVIVIDGAVSYKLPALSTLISANKPLLICAVPVAVLATPVGEPTITDGDTL